MIPERKNEIFGIYIKLQAAVKRTGQRKLKNAVKII